MGNGLENQARGGDNGNWCRARAVTGGIQRRIAGKADFLGNNLGAIIGAFITWFVWIEAEPVALWLVGYVNLLLDETNPLRSHLQEVAPHMRMVLMGLILVLVLRFRPKGILPEKVPDHY